jgi:hypothetical protein
MSKMNKLEITNSRSRFEVHFDFLDVFRRGDEVGFIWSLFWMMLAGVEVDACVDEVLFEIIVIDVTYDDKAARLSVDPSI